MPVDLFSGGFSETDLVPDLGVAMARTGGGLIITSRSSDPIVTGSLTTGPLTKAEHQDREAFLIDCVDRNLRVDFVHPLHAVPIAYVGLTLPFAGTATVNEFPTLRSAVMAGLPLDLDLRRGDRVSFEQNGMVLCRWVQADTLVTSATAQTVPLTPRLPIGVFSAGATAVFKDPKLRFLVEAGSIDHREVYEMPALSWNFVEALK